MNEGQTPSSLGDSYHRHGRLAQDSCLHLSKTVICGCDRARRRTGWARDTARLIVGQGQLLPCVLVPFACNGWKDVEVFIQYPQLAFFEKPCETLTTFETLQLGPESSQGNV